MRYRFIADVHLDNHRIGAGQIVGSINARGFAVLDALRFAAGTDAKLVGLGDIFDTARPIPQLIGSVARILKGKQAISIVGNHDRNSDHPDDHALFALEGVVDVVSTPRIVDGLLMIPFSAEPASEYIPAAMESASWDGDFKAVCFHAGVYAKGDFKLWDYTKSHDAISLDTVVEACREVGATRVFCGNWHEHKQWDCGDVLVTQVGALAPTGWDNPGTDSYGYCADYDSATGEVVPVRVPGPVFVECSPGEIARWTEYSDHGVFLRVSVNGETRAAVSELAVRAAAGNLGSIRYIGLVEEPDVNNALVHKAVTNVKSQATMLDAIERATELLRASDRMKQRIKHDLIRRLI